MPKKIKKIYLAGPLFGIADLHHNLHLECELRALGYIVVLPQRRAKLFVTAGELDHDGICQDCAEHAADPESMYVGNVDGPDADAGTAIEFALAMAENGRAIIYRTDIRTDPKKEIGISAMLRLKGSKYIHHPCHVIELEEVQPFYQELAQRIHEAILSYE